MKFRNWPTMQGKRISEAEHLANLAGVEDASGIEKAVEELKSILDTLPKTGRSIEGAARNEFVIPLTSAEQRDKITELLYDLSIFPWEENGELIVDHKRDLRKLEVVGIYRPYVEEVQVDRLVDGESSPEFAFPLPIEKPEQKAEAEEVNIKISQAKSIVSGTKVKSKEPVGEPNESVGVDEELRNIVDRFDQGLVDEGDETFTQLFGILPTLTLFPRQYIWEKGCPIERRTGEKVSTEEWHQLQREAKEGDEGAMNKLVRMHVGLVLLVVGRVKEKFGGDADDLFQVGLIELTKAIDQYDPSQGASFAHYAIIKIEAGLRKLSFEERMPIHRPAGISTEISDLQRTRRKVTDEMGVMKPEAVFEELPHVLRKITPHKDHKILPTGVGLDRLERLYLIGATFDPIESSEDNIVDAEAIKNQNESGFDAIPREVLNREARESINRALLKLSPRQERIIRLRFGLDGEEFTCEQIAEKFGISHSRVAQIEAKAIRLLKHPSRSRALRSLLDS